MACPIRGGASGCREPVPAGHDERRRPLRGADRPGPAASLLVPGHAGRTRACSRAWLRANPPREGPAFGDTVVTCSAASTPACARPRPEQQVGHSYFMVPDLDASRLRVVWEHHVGPLLKEYFAGHPDAWPATNWTSSWAAGAVSPRGRRGRVRQRPLRASCDERLRVPAGPTWRCPRLAGCTGKETKESTERFDDPPELKVTDHPDRPALVMGK